jgi:Kdo2-lipid IVA lauroyltransferase/acyltransferase
MKLFFVLFSKLPFWLLYLISDGLYYVLFYIIGYRKELVLKNLTESFPEKSEKELQKIRKKFYRHLLDVVVEILKIHSLSAAQIKKRVAVKGIENLTKALEIGNSGIVLGSHHCNWEWMSFATGLAQTYPLGVVYQKLSSKFFDDLMIEWRSKFGAVPVPMQNVLRYVTQYAKEPRILALLSDQSPSGNDTDLWTTFLNQETCFFMGGERISQKFGWVIVSSYTKKLRRGYYEIDFQIIENQDSKSITQQYTERLEANIREQPEYWLWSHNRWKSKRAIN